jgi:hypothetical protein
MGFFDDVSEPPQNYPDGVPPRSQTVAPVDPRLGGVAPVAPVQQPRGLFDDVQAGAPLTEPIPPNVVDWSRYNQPKGELKPADPNFTELVKQKGQDALIAAGVEPYRARHLSEGLVGIAGITPMGSVLSAGDLAYDQARRNYGHAALDVLGIVPGVMAGSRGVQAARGTLPMVQTAATPTRTIDPLTGKVTDELLDSGTAAYGRIANAPIIYHPDTIAHYADIAKNLLQQPGPRGVFSPEKAPNVFNTLDRFPADLQARGVTHVSPSDFDTLRGQLLGFSDPTENAAGSRAAEILGNYMHRPPQGAVVYAAPGAMDTLRADLAIARGDWRAGKTAQTVEKEIDRAGTRAGGAYSGQNVDNTTRQSLRALTTTDAGEQKIFGATYPEKQAINAVVAGDPTTNALRIWGNRLGGGGGAWQGMIGAGGSGMMANHFLSLGFDPTTATVLGSAAGLGAVKGGQAARLAANERTVKAAEEVVGMIRRNSPLYRAREALSPPIVDPFKMQRDAIAYAMIPQARQAGASIWDQLHVPYENRSSGNAP